MRAVTVQTDTQQATVAQQKRQALARSASRRQEATCGTAYMCAIQRRVMHDAAATHVGIIVTHLLGEGLVQVGGLLGQGGAVVNGIRLLVLYWRRVRVLVHRQRLLHDRQTDGQTDRAKIE